MIQRVQTLFLLLAAALTVVFMFVAYGYADFGAASTAELVREPLKATQEWVLMVPLCIGTVLFAAAIFLFRNLKVQKSVTAFAMLFDGVAALVTVYLLVSGMVDCTDGMFVSKTYWGGGGLILLAALVSGMMAYRGIASDERLLRSYDSIR